MPVWLKNAYTFWASVTVCIYIIRSIYAMIICYFFASSPAKQCRWSFGGYCEMSVWLKNALSRDCFYSFLSGLWLIVLEVDAPLLEIIMSLSFQQSASSWLRESSSLLGLWMTSEVLAPLSPTSSLILEVALIWKLLLFVVTSLSV